MKAKDQNRRILYRRVSRAQDGTWGANVWFGKDPATTLRRYFYETRAQAMDADVSDGPVRRGCVRFGEYA